MFWAGKRLTHLSDSVFPFEFQTKFSVRKLSDQTKQKQTDSKLKKAGISFKKIWIKIWIMFIHSLISKFKQFQWGLHSILLELRSSSSRPHLDSSFSVNDRDEISGKVWWWSIVFRAAAGENISEENWISYYDSRKACLKLAPF